MRNIAGKNKMATNMQHEVIQKIDWDEDKFERMVDDM